MGAVTCIGHMNPEVCAYMCPHLSIGAAVGAVTCIGHVKPPNWVPLPQPYGLCSRLLPMLLRGLLSAVSESRRIDVPLCGRVKTKFFKIKIVAEKNCFELLQRSSTIIAYNF